MSREANSKINFITPGVKLSLKNRKKLKYFIIYLLKKEGQKADCINYIFTTEKEIIQINKKYLKHSYATDIITFEYNLPQEPILSDIYISVDTVKSNAERFNSSFNLELHRVIFHGILHLCGYSDKKTIEIMLMREKEEYYLQKYFLQGVPRGT